MATREEHIQQFEEYMRNRTPEEILYEEQEEESDLSSGRHGDWKIVLRPSVVRETEKLPDAVRRDAQLCCGSRIRTK